MYKSPFNNQDNSYARLHAKLPLSFGQYSYPHTLAIAGLRMPRMKVVHIILYYVVKQRHCHIHTQCSPQALSV